MMQDRDDDERREEAAGEPAAGSGTTGRDAPVKRQAGAYARDAEQDPLTPPDGGSAGVAR